MLLRVITGVALLGLLLPINGCGPYIQDAVRADDPDQLRQMIDTGADPFKTGYKGETLLHLAANRNAVAAARLLLAQGLPVDSRDKDGRTPLHLAAFKGFAEMTALLLDHGADAALMDNRGQTPLHLARVSGHAALIALMDPLSEGGIEIAPEEEDWFARGNRLATGGRHAEAVRAYRLGLEQQGEDAKAYYNLGLCHLQLKQVAAALEAFQSAVRLDRDYARAYYNMGVVLGGQARFESAAAAFREVLRIDPDDGEAWYNLGNCLDRLAQYEQALNAWQEALRVAPDNPDPRFNMALVLDSLGRKDEARAQYEVLRGTHPAMAADLAHVIGIN